jgi:hypothetical protein
MELVVRWDGCLQSQKMPLEPTMYMKTKGLRGNLMLERKILSDSIKSSYIVARKMEWGNKSIKNRG